MLPIYSCVAIRAVGDTVAAASALSLFLVDGEWGSLSGYPVELWVLIRLTIYFACLLCFLWFRPFCSWDSIPGMRLIGGLGFEIPLFHLPVLSGGFHCFSTHCLGGSCGGIEFLDRGEMEDERRRSASDQSTDTGKRYDCAM